ncbi:MAG: class I SAM-dependent methyltransferase [Candidatus Bathyarchaeia archaeon]
MEKDNPPKNEWLTIDHVLAYLARADKLPHRTEGERVLLEQIPGHTKRILDLGTGDGRLMSLVKLNRPRAEGVALDFSEPMLERATERFTKETNVTVFKHDLRRPLPAKQLGCFDAIVSSLAIHHLEHPRKRQLYKEVFSMLNPKGVFCNLDRVASSTENVHVKFLKFSGVPRTEDPSNRLLDVETQLKWLRQIGFTDVDCYWKWMEMALMMGFKP